MGGAGGSHERGRRGRRCARGSSGKLTLWVRRGLAGETYSHRLLPCGSRANIERTRRGPFAVGCTAPLAHLSLFPHTHPRAPTAPWASSSASPSPASPSPPPSPLPPRGPLPLEPLPTSPPPPPPRRSSTHAPKTPSARSPSTTRSSSSTTVGRWSPCGRPSSRLRSRAP